MKPISTQLGAAENMCPARIPISIPPNAHVHAMSHDDAGSKGKGIEGIQLAK